MGGDKRREQRDPEPWTELGREKLHDCKVFDVSRTLSRSPRTGEIHPFYRIDAAEWVNVVALTPGGEIVMVRQYRHGSGEITLEIPGGMVDPGERPASAAARELLEHLRKQLLPEPTADPMGCRGRSLVRHSAALSRRLGPCDRGP